MALLSVTRRNLILNSIICFAVFCDGAACSTSISKTEDNPESSSPSGFKKDSGASCENGSCSQPDGPDVGSRLDDDRDSSTSCTGVNCYQFEVPEICLLPMAVGACIPRGELQRYYFNTQTGDCEQFIYSGCEGNDNNFRSQYLCRKTCLGESDESRCIIDDVSIPSGSMMTLDPDGCSGCICLDGRASCTDRGCGELDAGFESCAMRFEQYPVGTTGIMAYDGCNTCFCEGPWLDCTLNPCIRYKGKIELYRVDTELWQSEVGSAYELVKFAVGDPVLTADDIISYDWDNHLLTTSVQVLNRWESLGFVDSNFIAMEPVLFLLLANDRPVFALTLWPMHFSSMPPCPYIELSVDQETVLFRIQSPDPIEGDRDDADLYRALWEAKLLLNPATGPSTCTMEGIRYPAGMRGVSHPTNYNDCECMNEEFACHLMYLGEEKQESEYSPIVNGPCSEYVSIDNPTVRNGIIYLDCGSAVDGPSYYFREGSGELISECGGACLTPDKKQLEVCRNLCPPPDF